MQNKLVSIANDDFENTKKIDENGELRKQKISLVQTYFAIQTRRQEAFFNLNDNEKRIYP